MSRQESEPPFKRRSLKQQKRELKSEAKWLKLHQPQTRTETPPPQHKQEPDSTSMDIDQDPIVSAGEPKLHVETGDEKKARKKARKAAKKRVRATAIKTETFVPPPVIPESPEKHAPAAIKKELASSSRRMPSFPQRKLTDGVVSRGGGGLMQQLKTEQVCSLSCRDMSNRCSESALADSLCCVLVTCRKSHRRLTRKVTCRSARRVSPYSQC